MIKGGVEIIYYLISSFYLMSICITSREIRYMVLFCAFFGKQMYLKEI
jgi:hypothetical protein